MKKGPKNCFTMGGARDKSLRVWKDKRPAWVRELAEACDASSQTKVARRIGYSPAVVSSVLGHSYRGDYEAVEQSVRGALMSETVECPVVGEIRKDRCLTHQRKARSGLTATSSMRVQITRACRGNCPHSRIKGANHA